MKISHAKKLAAALNKELNNSVISGEYKAKVIDNKIMEATPTRADVVILMEGSTNMYSCSLIFLMEDVFKKMDSRYPFIIIKDCLKRNPVDFILIIF